MVIIFYIVLVCYMPIMEMYLPKTNFGAGIPDIGPVEFFSYLLVMAFFIESAIRHHFRIMSKWTFILIFYSVVVFASISWSPYYSYNASEIRYIFKTVILPMFVAIIAMNTFTNPKKVNIYIRHIMIMACILSLVSIYQMLKGFSAVSTEMRAAATLGNPNILAVCLVTIVPLILYAIDNHIFPRKLCWVMLLIVIGGLICTVSRKGYATCFMSMLLYSYLKGHTKRVIVFIFLAVMMVAALSGYSMIAGRFSSQKIQREFAGKTAMARAGLHMFSKSPVVGSGYKGYYEQFGYYFPNSIHDNYDAHNIFITALANYGLLGMIPFLLLFFYPLGVALKAIRKSKIGRKQVINRDMAIVCLCFIMTFMLSGYFAGGLVYVPVVVFILYTNIILVLNSRHWEDDLDGDTALKGQPGGFGEQPVTA